MTNRRRVGAIDIGTNTVLLLVAEGDADAPSPRLERATITRLGEGVDRSRRLLPEAIRRTTACLSEYRALLDDEDVQHIDVVCTSAARDAENGAAFLDEAEAALGTRPRIIDGLEEARLTFDGALTGLHVHGKVTVFDIGGGSTEIIHGRLGPSGVGIDRAVSLDVGSVRLTERHVRHDPPTAMELDSVRMDIEQALRHAPRDASPTVVGVAGTVTTLAAIDRELAVYDPARVHGAVLPRDTIRALGLRLATMPLAERRALPGLDPGRADVIIAGTLLVTAILDWLDAPDLLVSDRGVRWGLARGILKKS